MSLSSAKPETQRRQVVPRVLMLALLSAVIVIGLLAVPMYVIRPFRPQDAHALAFALTVRHAAPWMSALCVLLTVYACTRAWPFARVTHKLLLLTAFLVTLGGACLTHVNIFEVMFKPYGSPVFISADAAGLDADDKVLAVTIAGESHAYPVRTMGYHHVVNDVVAGQPVAATYCTLCHTGLVWSRRVIRRDTAFTSHEETLTFRLAGINNGNALLRDEQTSSIWQQSTGEAIFGPLKGSRLRLVHADELSFALWRAEQPNGLVLRPEAQFASAYDPKDWEQHVERTPAVVDTSKSGFGPHELMLGLTVDGLSKAYPFRAILAAGLIEDRIGELPVVIVVGPDHSSIRVFKAKQGDDTPPATFIASSGAPGEIMKDTETGSAFNFTGCAISGKYAGQCLTPIDSHKDYWFDWLNHNPSTAVFKN